MSNVRDRCPSSDGVFENPVFLLRKLAVAYTNNEVLGRVNIIGVRNEWLLMIMMANDFQGWMGPKFSRYLSYNWRKLPVKQPVTLTLPGIEPGPLGEMRRCHRPTTAVVTETSNDRCALLAGKLIIFHLFLMI